MAKRQRKRERREGRGERRENVNFGLSIFPIAKTLEKVKRYKTK